MTLLGTFGLGPGTSAAAVHERVHALGADASEGPPDPASGVRALRVSGQALAAEGLGGLVLYVQGERVVRARMYTDDRGWTTRLGPPTRQAGEYALWAWKEPQWSLESWPEGEGLLLDAKFFDEAVAAGNLTEAYVQRLFATV